MTTRSRTRSRGMTILEVMIAMTVLAVGLLAIAHLHALGLSSNAAGRRQTNATALAGELVTGLERLGFTDPLLLENGPAAATPPPLFGPLVAGGGTIAAGAHVWDDANPVAGVRLTTDLRESAETSASYQRRWTVWAVQLPGGLVGAKIIAVSVTWNDPPFLRPREVVQYGFVSNQTVLGGALGGSP